MHNARNSLVGKSISVSARNGCSISLRRRRTGHVAALT